MIVELVGCHSYRLEEDRPNMPQIKLRITTPLRKNVEINVLVDTGYDGSLLLPVNLFTSLNIPALPESEFRALERPDGSLMFLPRGIAQVEITGQIFPVVEVEAIDTLNEILVGRELLQELDMALLGKKSLICQIKEKNHESTEW